MLAVFCNGCKDYPPEVKEGTLFAAPEKASPAKALAYIYWPREQQGGRNHLWVGPCEGSSQEILPGGYTALVVEPGPSCFQAEVHSELMRSRGSRSQASASASASASAFVTQFLGSVELNAQPGRTFFIRIEQERLLLISRAVLRVIEPGVAGREISRCRRSIPLTPDELYRQDLEEHGR